MRATLKKAIDSAIIIIKLVVPIYILADILYYYNLLSYISFILEPITSILNLPLEASLVIISGVFLNLYAAVAFVAPLKMSAMEWSILAIFLGVCHSLVVENFILKKLGINLLYSYLLRFFGGLVIAYSATFIPKEYFNNASFTSKSFYKEEYNSIYELLMNSFLNSIVLSLKIIILITILIFIMEYIKRLDFIKNSKRNLSKGFSILVGLILGITYGAGVLFSEASNLKREDIFFVATFLMIAHAIIEDTLLFVIFGANFYIVILVRLIWAILLAYLLTSLYRVYKRD